MRVLFQAASDNTIKLPTMNNPNKIRRKSPIIASGWTMSIGFILIILAFILNFIYVSMVTTTRHDNLGGYYLDIIEDSILLTKANKKEKAKASVVESWRLESSVFGQILKRALANLESSLVITHHHSPSLITTPPHS